MLLFVNPKWEVTAMKRLLTFISVVLTAISVYIFFAYNNIIPSLGPSSSQAFSTFDTGTENIDNSSSATSSENISSDFSADNLSSNSSEQTSEISENIPSSSESMPTAASGSETEKQPSFETENQTESVSQSQPSENSRTESGNFAPQPTSAAPISSGKVSQTTSEFFKAFWVATIYGLDYPSQPTTDSDTLKREADEIISFAADNGYNAIILQVRPAADSFFDSAYFPWSEFLTGKQGKAPKNNFDPLKYWTEQAHSKGIELHAWLNPYRVTKGGTADKPATADTLSSSHPARKNPGWVSMYSDGNLYFNPGIPEVRRLILDSIGEILENYDVDGIHFDDYFYPGKNFEDSDAFSTYGSTFASVEDFRRSSVDSLIKGIHDLIAEKKPGCSFGISPFGIWANKSTNPEGSNTKGTQSYYDHFADTRKWVKEGWIDYIAPQLYWNIGNSSADYDTLLKWWLDTISGTNVKLYIGHAAYRAGNEEQSSPWYGTTEIINQLSLNRKSGKVSGSIFFRYQFLKSYSELTDDISAFFSQQDDKIPVDGTVNSVPSETASGTLYHSPGQTAQTTAAEPTSSLPTDKPTYSSETQPTTSESSETQSPTQAASESSGSSTVGSDFPAAAKNIAKLSISRPGQDTSTNYDSFYISGSSDPNLPLYLNGELVNSRSGMGFFGVLVSLKSGTNTFTFSQGETSVTRTIKKGVTSSSVAEMSKIEISPSSTFPQSDEYRKTGEKITLKCSAPAGSQVNVQINGETFTMSSASSARSDGKIVAATYTYSYTIPQVTASSGKSDLGIPKYTAVFKDKTYTQSAKGNVVALSNNAPIYATVIKDVADTYATAASSKGADKYLYKGMTAQVTGMTGEYVRLSHGCWIKKHNVKISTESKKILPVISDAVYTVGEKYDTISFKSSAKTSAIANLDKTTLTLKIAPALKTCDITLPQNSLFESYSIDSGSGYEAYTFVLKPDSDFDGFYIEQTDGGFKLLLKHRPKISPGDTPLKGINIVLDAGHGGTDNGALGCMGTIIAEKHTNFNITKKLKSELEKLGANVTMTRADDTYIALQDRQFKSFEKKPDLFLSIHANSLNDNVDISKVSGYSVYYKNAVGEKFAQTLFNGIKAKSDLDNRGIHTSNLYVTRASWTPSVILETAFIPNPSDFQWLIDSSASSEFAKTLAEIIVEYFS